MKGDIGQQKWKHSKELREHATSEIWVEYNEILEETTDRGNVDSATTRESRAMQSVEIAAGQLSDFSEETGCWQKRMKMSQKKWC